MEGRRNQGTFTLLHHPPPPFSHRDSTPTRHIPSPSLTHVHVHTGVQRVDQGENEYRHPRLLPCELPAYSRGCVHVACLCSWGGGREGRERNGGREIGGRWGGGGGGREGWRQGEREREDREKR